MSRNPQRAQTTAGRSPITNAARDPAAPWSPIRLAWSLLLWTASVSGIGVGLYYLAPLATAAIDAEAQLKAAPPGTDPQALAPGGNQWRLVWTTTPPPNDAWIIQDIEQAQASSIDSLRHTSIHASDLCARVAAALGQSPWISQVQRVSKRSDGVVSVQAVFREYVTFVVRDGTAYLVDKNAVRLPRQEPLSNLEASRTNPPLILIEGVREPPPPVGKEWPPGDVAAGRKSDVLVGLKLVQFLSRRAPQELLAVLMAVDVSNYEYRQNRRDGWLRIRTSRPGTTVLWGLPPGEEYDIECTAERKLGLLWTLVENGQLPDRRTVDVRDETRIQLNNTP